MRISEIQCTTDPKKFQLFPENRPISLPHVRNIKKSMTVKNMSYEFPLLVTRDFFIIDGQHRYHALMDLKYPIYFRFVDEWSPDDLNLLADLQTHKPWRLSDHLHRFKTRKLKPYLDFDFYLKNYGLSFSSLFRIVKPKKNGVKEFQKGKIAMPSGIDNFLVLVKDLNEKMSKLLKPSFKPLLRRNAWTDALWFTYRKYPAKFKELCQKIPKSVHELESYVHISSFLDKFEEIYNKHKSDDECIDLKYRKKSKS